MRWFEGPWVTSIVATAKISGGRRMRRLCNAAVVLGLLARVAESPPSLFLQGLNARSREGSEIAIREANKVILVHVKRGNLFRAFPMRFCTRAIDHRHRHRVRCRAPHRHIQCTAGQCIVGLHAILCERLSNVGLDGLSGCDVVLAASAISLPRFCDSAAV